MIELVFPSISFYPNAFYNFERQGDIIYKTIAFNKTVMAGYPQMSQPPFPPKWPLVHFLLFFKM